MNLMKFVCWPSGHQTKNVNVNVNVLFTWATLQTRLYAIALQTRWTFPRLPVPALPMNL